jgi:hypothetical protein
LFDATSLGRQVCILITGISAVERTPVDVALNLGKHLITRTQAAQDFDDAFD